ncbi:MAG TPA: hypothetical protein VHB21_16735, partial [Minicystis sp.]|nr:hypothetical protein [Minicystis sp.]
RVLLASLVAPYADGFAFVQERRRAGGWAAVDAAYARLPQTTEQLMHHDKYAANEPALKLPRIDVAGLGPGYRARLEDDMGEESLRIMLEAWSTPDAAAAAAAGWGGDREVLAESKAGGATTLAVAYHVRFDAPKLADGMAALLKQKFPPCRERKGLGPFGWQRRGADVVIVGGPYARDGKSVRAAGDCAVANRWMKAILDAR